MRHFMICGHEFTCDIPSCEYPEKLPFDCKECDPDRKTVELNWERDINT